MLKYLILSLLSSLSLFGSTQPGIIKGQLIDKNTNETIIGASVTIAGTNIGTVTDFDGKFELVNVPSGKVDLHISYVGFKKITKSYELTPGVIIEEAFQLEEETMVLADVVVVGKVNKQNAIALTMLQQKSPGMITGIANDDIKKAPDRTTSDVLKRVSGASIVDQKFVIIRGLADRYNNALLNGNLLPSTEPDKRAFSFDLFPSSVLSNLVIFKTATPDLPGEFAGGIVQVNTKEVAEEAFVECNLGAGFNSESTFKPYSFYQGGSKDWMGYDRSTRALDPRVTKAALSDPNSRFATSLYVPNDWIVNSYASMMPSQSLQLSGGKTLHIGENRLGVIGALTYQNTNRMTTVNRADFNIDNTQIYAYSDQQNKRTYHHGGMLNASYNFNSRNKISFNNLASILGDDQYIERQGHEIEQTRNLKAYSMLYTSTATINNQLTGEHELTSGGSSLKWSVAHAYVNKNTPSYRRMTYIRNDDAAYDDPYYAYIPVGFPSPNYAGRFYSDQKERFYTGRLDFTQPLFGKESSLLKMGVSGDHKERTFDARVFGYTYAKSSIPQELLVLPVDEILAHEHINPNGFVLKESTNPSDSYAATGKGFSGYAMMDHALFGEQLRFIAGLRMELFNQTLQSYEYGGKEISLNETDVDYLPSVNLVYSLNKHSNLRFSASETVIRPNFRELAPFSFYDFNLSAAIVGNPDLQRTQVFNLDLKYEAFFSGGQQFSFTAFYKRFKNPVEQIYETLGAGTKNFNFENADRAENFGLEAEVRYELSNIWSRLDGFQFRGNAAWIHSMVDLSSFAGQNANERPLQSQSPYLVNLALSYTHHKAGFGASVLYNSIGRRIWLVGSNGYLDTYEAPRNLVDLQLTQRIGKKLQLKLAVSDLLNESFRFYQDQNDSGKYDQGDTLIQEHRAGVNYSLSLNLMLR